MLVKELMTKNPVTISAGAAVSEAFAKMESRKIHQLIVTGEAPGMVTLRDIVTRSPPLGAKISNFTISCPSIEADRDAKEAAELILRSGLRALPVMEKGSLAGIISETDLMDIVTSESGASGIAAPCEYVSPSDRIGKAIDIMAQRNVSRVPVVDKGALAGVVGTLDLIKLLRGREKLRGGRLQEMGVQEKMRLEETHVATIMSEASAFEGGTLREAAQLLKKSEELFMADGGIFVITPKDVLEAQIGGARKGVLVQITNLEDESAAVVDKMHGAVAASVKKIGKMVDGIEYVFLHVERHKKAGARMKYSIRTRFSTPIGFFVSHAWGWDPVTVTQSAMDRLEHEIMKKRERLAERRMRRRREKE